MNLRRLLLSCLSFVFVGCAVKSVITEVPEDHPANPNAAAVPFVPPPNVLADVAVVTPVPDGAEVQANHHQHEAGATTQPAHEKHAESTVKSDNHEHDQQQQHEHQPAESVQDLVDTLASAYLNLSDLLAQDKTDGAVKQLTVIHMAASDLTGSDNEKMTAIAERVTEGANNKDKDIESLRNSFKSISPAVIELVHLMPPSAKVAPTIRQAYCPMAKASWLQTGEIVTNPYFGSAMLRCGKVTETIEAQGDKK